MPPQPTDQTATPAPVAPVVETPSPAVAQENLQPTTQPQAVVPETYAPQAPQIMFEGETPVQQIQSAGMMQWIIANSGGVIKNEKQALNTLLGIIGVAVAISIYALFFSGPSSNIEPPPIMDDSFVPLTERQDFSL